jgi:TRAP-type C4-dicarboxylate transport system permease small subunit
MKVIKELLTSKKFLAMLAAIVVYVGGRLGFDVDPAALDRICAALLVYVGAQGVADAGKSAALIKAVVATSGVEPEATAAVKRIAASVVVLLVVLGAGGLAISCATGP